MPASYPPPSARAGHRLTHPAPSRARSASSRARSSLLPLCSTPARLIRFSRVCPLPRLTTLPRLIRPRAPIRSSRSTASALPPLPRPLRCSRARSGVGGLRARCSSRGIAEVPPGAQVVDLGAVEGFPLPGVDVAQLVAMLGSVPVAEVSGAALVNGVAAWQQVLNMVQAAQAAWVRELEARTPDALRHVPDELACALVSTRRHAETLFLRAWGTAQHPALADAWTAGAVDARKVDVILDEVGRAGGSLSRSEVAAVVADAVDHVRVDDRAALTRHVRTRLIAADPAVAEQRRVVERERRGVFLDLAPDAMARLIAYLPAAEATAAFTAIDALAGNAADGRGRPDGGPASRGRVRRRVHLDPGPPGDPGRHAAADPARAAGRPPGERRGHHVAGAGRRPRPPRLLRADPRAGGPRARPGRHLAARAHGSGHRPGLRRRHHGLPARRGPDPDGHGPGRDVHVPRLSARLRSGARSTTASRTTSLAAPTASVAA